MASQVQSTQLRQHLAAQLRARPGDFDDRGVLLVLGALQALGHDVLGGLGEAVRGLRR